MTRTELVGELERLEARLFGHDESVLTPWFGASEFLDLAGMVGVTVCRADAMHQVDRAPALEADGAQEARHVAGAGAVGAERVGDVSAVDVNEAVVGASGQLVPKSADFANLCDVFALDFAELALSLYRPCLEGGEIAFECADVAAAQKKTKALKWLAEKLDGEGREIGRDAHAAIIAYAAMRG